MDKVITFKCEYCGRLWTSDREDGLPGGVKAPTTGGGMVTLCRRCFNLHAFEKKEEKQVRYFRSVMGKCLGE